MAIVRTAIWGVLVCTAAATSAQAGQLTMLSEGSPWTYYLTAQQGYRSETNWNNLAGWARAFDRTHAFSPVSASIHTAPAPTPAPVVAAPPPPVVGVQPIFANQPILASASSAPVSAAMTTLTAAPAMSHGPSPATYDAYINFNPSNLPEASSLTVGTPAAWYTSPTVQKAFGGTTPTADQQTQFLQDVKADVEKTFALAGMSPKITLDSSMHANHTLSIASGLSYGPNGSAIGITDVGASGFGFIDKLNYATDASSLAWAVAHNVSHELMHAFGLSNHPDQSGKFIDAASATWDLLTNPNTTFSPAATAALTNPTSSDLGVYTAQTGTSTQVLRPDGDMEILATPEPATLAAWGSVLAGAFLYRRRSARAAA